MGQYHINQTITGPAMLKTVQSLSVCYVEKLLVQFEIKESAYEGEVPQGSVVGPKIFILYIKDIWKVSAMVISKSTV